MANTLKFGNGQWATGTGTALAYNDENANYKPLPFDFTRASSATVVNQQGLIETVGSGIPRIDFQGNTKGALLLEPSRTNVIPYSQTFTGWSLTNVVETPNALISPDGNLNASKFVTINNGVDIKYANVPVVQNTTYTYSFYCNYVGGLSLQGRFYDNTNGANIEYYDYMNQLEEGKWKRVTRTFTTPSGCSNIQVWYLASSSTFPVTAYYWGAQLEAGSYPTSYIPTSGSAVTRVKDAQTQTLPDRVVNSAEGVFYAELKALSNDNSNRYISLSDGSTSNRVVLRFTTNNEISGFVVSGTTQASFSYSINILNKNKIALKWKQNDFSFWVNGIEVGTDTIGVPPINLNLLRFEDAVNNGQFFYAQLNDLKIYNTALTDQELQALTSN